MARSSSWKDRYPDWYGDFFKAHVGRCLRPGWPEPGKPAWPAFFEVWAEELARLKANPEEARAASFHLAANPPDHISEHLPRLVARIEQARREGTATPGDRAEAERRSVDCPDCGGAGMASVEHDVPDRGRLRFAYYCVCPLGRWIKGAHDRDPKGPRLRDLAQYPHLRVDQDAEPEAKHLEIGQWFAARRRAAAEGRPMPPIPACVEETERAYRQRNAPIPGKSGPPQPRVPRGVSDALAPDGGPARAEP